MFYIHRNVSDRKWWWVFLENAKNSMMALNFVHGTKLKFICFSIVIDLKEKRRATQFPEGANKSSENTNPYVGLLQGCIGKRTSTEAKGVHAHIIKLEPKELLDCLSEIIVFTCIPSAKALKTRTKYLTKCRVCEIWVIGECSRVIWQNGWTRWGILEHNDFWVREEWSSWRSL